MGQLEVATADGAMGVYDAVPATPARAAVVVVQEAFGVNPHIRAVADRFAESGYRAVAPHLFHRTGDPELSYTDIDSIRPHMQALTEPGLLADLDGVLRYLAEGGFEAARVGIVGFCMGGSVAMFAGSRFDLGAAVSFYGGGVVEARMGMPSLLEVARELRCPWLGLYGDLDQGIPVEQVEALRSAAATASVDTEVVRYPEAGHGFHCDARPSAYHAASATDAWRRTLDWFGRYLPGGHVEV